MEPDLERSPDPPGEGRITVGDAKRSTMGVDRSEIPPDLLIAYRSSRRLMGENARACFVESSDCLRRFFGRETEIHTSSLPEALRGFVQGGKVPGWWKRQARAVCRHLETTDVPPCEESAVRLLTLLRGLFRFYYGVSESGDRPSVIAGRRG